MNQYHIYDKIGRGKASVVYKGRKKKTIQYYAVKSVEKGQKSRVLQEVRTMHALDHKNILKFFAWYETSNHLWLILEYCVGGDLMSLLRQDSALPESSIHDFGRDMAGALQYLHASSIIYCDLKPSNVLLDENGRLKLGGFGLSRRLSDINKNPVTNLPPAKRGTPCYMAPELFSEGATHSTASDLWAFGCVLYECAAGRPPFLNASFNQLAYEILNNDPAPLPGASREFSHLLSRLLDKNPATRIKWPELAQHPFWQTELPSLDMPSEPALQEFVRRYNLAPADNGTSTSSKAARSMRESVDVTRLSRIALNNLEREGDGGDYAAAQAGTSGDIAIDSADAELDFEEVAGREAEANGADEDAAAGAPSSEDAGELDGAQVGDATGHVDVVGAMSSDAVKAQARPRLPPDQGTQPSSSRPTVGRMPDASDSSSPSSSSASLAAAAAANGSHKQLHSRGTAQHAGSAGADVDTAAALDSGGQVDGAGTSTMDSLIWHASDSAVKPIVANRRIERLPELKWDAKALPFAPMSLQEMLNTDQRELEAFLTHIYRAVASAAPLKDKVNVLAYFESLCVDTNAANVLINSSLTVLFVRMLRNSRAPLLRVRLASVLGLLVRHATFIAEELAGTQVVEILTEALKDKNERVRRRVMATLGELLFYIATQQQDSGTGSVADVSAAWGIGVATVAAVTRLLKPSEDDIAQHYAVKTIENICSQDGEWATKFATQDVMVVLVAIYTSAKGENLKATAASALSRVLHANSPLLPQLLDKYGSRLLIAGLSDPSSKVQASSLNMLNMALAYPDLAARHRTAIQEERGLLPALAAALDHSLPLLRAKAAVSVLLLCRWSPRWLAECCKLKLIPLLERLAREKDAYTQDALAALKEEVARQVAVVCDGIQEELATAAGTGFKRQGSLNGRPQAQGQKGALGQFQVVLHMVTSPTFRTATITPALIEQLAGFLTATSNPSLSLPGLSDFKGSLMHVLEALCQQSELLQQHPQPILRSLLPALCSVTTSPSESGDARFFCLRMLSDVLGQFLADPSMAEAGSSASSSQRRASAAGEAEGGGTLSTLLRLNVLPMVPVLLDQEDPMPLYALKLLGGVLEVEPGLVSHPHVVALAPRFFDFLSLEHPNNNVHNIRLCRQLLVAGSLGNGQLQQLGVADKVCAVLAYAHQNNVEPFLEPVLELCHAIATRDAADLAAGTCDGALLGALLQQLPVLLDLATHPEAPVAVAAAQCLAELVTLFPADTSSWLLSSDGAAILTAALQGMHLDAGAAPAPAMQQHLLAAICAAAPAHEAAGVADVSSELQQLGAALSALKLGAQGGDDGVKAAVARAEAALAPRLQQ